MSGYWFSTHYDPLVKKDDPSKAFHIENIKVFSGTESVDNFTATSYPKEMAMRLFYLNNRCIKFFQFDLGQN